MQALFFPIPTVVIDNVIVDLHDFPHIQARVQAQWGTYEGRSYLRSLLDGSDRRSLAVPACNKRRVNGDFPPQYRTKLEQVLKAHDALYPNLCH